MGDEERFPVRVALGGEDIKNKNPDEQCVCTLLVGFRECETELIFGRVRLRFWRRGRGGLLKRRQADWWTVAKLQDASSVVWVRRDREFTSLLQDTGTTCL